MVGELPKIYSQKSPQYSSKIRSNLRLISPEKTSHGG